MYVSDASRVLLNFFSLANEKPSSSVGSQSQLDSLSKHHLMLSQKCIWLQMSLTQYNIMTSFNNYLVRCYLFSRIQNKFRTFTLLTDFFGLFLIDSAGACMTILVIPLVCLEGSLVTWKKIFYRIYFFDIKYPDSHFH